MEIMKELNLIRKLAWSFHRSTGLDLDDLLQEASYGYCLALKSYDKSRGAFTTHLWYVINSHLKNYLRQEHKYSDPLERIDNLTVDSHPYSSAGGFWESLSQEAQLVADLVLSSPKMYVSARKEDCIERIYSVLSSQGWSDKKIFIALDDLQMACK